MRGLWCIVACCNRNSDKKPVKLFSFPKAYEQRQKWIQFVRTTRSDFTGPGLSHSKGVKVCDAHFEESCFLRKPWHQKSLLKSTAVPSIWAGCNSSSSSAKCRTGTCLRAKLQDTVPSKLADSTSSLSRGTKQCQDTAVPVIRKQRKRRLKLSDTGGNCQAGSTLISTSRTNCAKQCKRQTCAGSISVSPVQKPKLTHTVVPDQGATLVSPSRTKLVSPKMTKHARNLIANGELQNGRTLKSGVSMPDPDKYLKT